MYIENWFTHLHAFVRQINARLVIKNTYRPNLERESDMNIMDAILGSSVILSKNQLRHVHNWRNYFQVQKLSDITTPSGDRILPMYLQFPESDVPSPRVSRLRWPHQPRPTCEISFKLWTRCLRVCFLHGRSTELVRPLGKWIVHQSGSESIWPSYIHKTYQVLLHRTVDNRWAQYSMIQRTTSCTTTFDSSHCEYITTIPDDFIPVKVDTNNTALIANHAKQRIISTAKVACLIPNDMIGSISTSSLWKKHLLQHFHIHDPALFTSILQDPIQKLIVVLDGGLSAGKGSFGVAFGTNADDIGSIEGPAPGNSILMTSLRSEAYGALAALAFLNLYVKTYSLAIPPNQKIYFYSDNLGLIRWMQEILNNRCYPRMYLRAEADVISQIQSEISELLTLRFSLIVEHVKGHQDDVVTYSALPREAQLNVKADSSATNYIRNGVHQRYEEMDDNTVSIYICDNLNAILHIQ